MKKIRGTFIFISGSPGAAAIGNRLLADKEILIEKCFFTMQRIQAQEASKLPYKMLPALKIGEEVLYGKQIFEFIEKITYVEEAPPEPETYEEYLLSKCKYSKKNGVIKFDDDLVEEDFNSKLSKKMMTHMEKKGTVATTSPAPDKVKDVAVAEINDPEDDLARWRNAIARRN